MQQLLMGLALGIIILLPGMSGGTVLLIFGLYETLMKDVANLKIVKHIPLAIGCVLGIIVSGMLFTYFFTAYRDPSMALLLGCLLGSIKAVLSRVPKINFKWSIFMLLGLVIGFIVVREPMGTGVLEKIGPLRLFLGGALSSAAMIIPGVPGSSVLILMNMYEEIIYYVGIVKVSKLLIFGVGSLIGMALLVKLLSKLYDTYRSELSYLFAGIIVGSSRALLPFEWGVMVILLFAAGFTFTFAFSDRI